MPTRNFILTTTDEIKLIRPPKNRKLVVRMIEAYNLGTTDVVLALKQVSPKGDYDGSQSKAVTTIPIAAGQSHIVNDSEVYVLERGWELRAQLSAASNVSITLTYELK